MSRKITVPTIHIQSDSQTALNTRRHSSSGKFTIIDEQSKDSDSFDETSSDNDDIVDQFMSSRSGYIRKCSSPNLPHLNYSISQPSKMSTLGTNVSRFRVVPVEAKYKRNRWLAWDWFDFDVDRHQLSLSGTIVRGSHSNPPTPTIATRSVFQLTPPLLKRSTPQSRLGVAPLATPEPMPSVHFDFSDESDQENSFPSPNEKNQITVRNVNNNILPNMQRTSSITELRDGLQNSRRLSPAPPGISPMAGRISPSEMLNQFGLERSLSVTSSPRVQIKSNTLSPDRALYLNESSTGAVSTTNSHVPYSTTNIYQSQHAPSSSIVAIDSKIEQAMDLVKTHLMFAVREEVENLRSRIVELETAVVHLEAENSMLRDHVPNEILQSLSIQPTSNQIAMT